MDRSNLTAADFIGRLRDIAGCITDRPVLGSGVRPADRIYHAGFAPLREPLHLRSESGNVRVQLLVRIDYVVRPLAANHREGAVRVVGYSYRIADRDDRELLAWHWHPVGSSLVTHTHLHVSSQIAPLDLGRGLDPLPIADLHIPTGQVGLADVVRFLIADVGVQPRKPSWRSVLGGEA